MIEYARSKPWKEKRQTLVHFYNNLEVTPNNTNANSYAEGMLLEKAKGKASLIGTYQKVRLGSEYWWSGASITNQDISEEEFEKNVFQIK